MDNTPYDDVFRTLLTDCTELMIPVVNEIFHTKYTGKETPIPQVLKNQLYGGSARWVTEPGIPKPQFLVCHAKS